MAEIINISPINPITFELQDYSIEDTSLITNLEVPVVFDFNRDKLEFFIYNLNNQLLFSDVSGYPDFTVTNDDSIILDPGANVLSQGYREGQFNVVYNFVSPILASDSNSRYFISEISPDRTEVRLDTTQIPNDLVVSSSLALQDIIINSTGSYYDFYLDFGDNTTQTPIWIRPRSLMSANKKHKKSLRKDYIQIVGHTQMRRLDISGSDKFTGGRYYFIDTMETSGEYLIIENNKLRVNSVK